MTNDKAVTQFNLENPVTGQSISIGNKIPWDCGLDEMVSNFSQFLLAAGYMFPEGYHLGFEKDDDVCPYCNDEDEDSDY